MSTAGIASIALFAPVVASNAVFSARRASRGIDAIEENPAFALANIDIAAAQILKGGRAVKGIALATDPVSGEIAQGAADAIKEASKTNKLLKGTAKVISKTADYINPVIIGAGVLKVAGADDKVDEGARESTRLLCMFGAEAATKDFIGLPFTEKVNGKTIAKEREGSYKKLMNVVFKDEQRKAINDFVKTRKSVKYAIGGAKGLLFCGASIAGYQLGDKLANYILGEKKESN